MSKPLNATPSSVEERMNQIRALMARMQQEEGSLDESLGLYKEATSLIAECQKILDMASKNLENPENSDNSVG